MALHRNVRGGKPSPYPRIVFHALRSAQLIGAIVVSAVMIYFMHHLRNDFDHDGQHFSVPWTFILLLSVSLATMTALLITIVLYNFTYLSPRFNLILNGSIAVGWALGLGLLTWSIAGSDILSTSCTAANFRNDAGAAVCREYKALWSMTFCGTISTFLALILDIITLKKEHRLGAYAKPADDQAAQELNDKKSMRVRSRGYEAPEEQIDHVPAWQAPEDDITYRSSYTANPRGPLDSHDGDMGYRDHH